MNEKKKYGMATRPIHQGTEGKESQNHPVNVPIYASSTFAFPTVDHGARIFSGEDPEGFTYGRLANPTVRDVEHRIAALENGEEALLLASGMAAIATCVFSILKKGDHVIADHTLYGGTHSLFTHKLPELGIEVSFVNASIPDEIEAEIRPNTKLIYFESIVNPTLRIVAIKPIVEIGKKHNILTAVDSTFLSPILQRPIDYGIDIVIHSATKYLNGHSDIIAGVIISSHEIISECRVTAVHYGGILGPFEAYLLGRGIKTLKIRVMEHEKNGKIIADYLASHPMIKKVTFPGHKSHPQHQLAKEQQEGFGSMITFEINGDLETAKTFVDALELFTRAVSLGGVESLISHPASTTHSIVSDEDKLKAGITDTLMRVSVGIEDPEDLIADLEQAFNKIKIVAIH